MNKMTKVQIVCQGITPLMMDKMSDETLDSLIGGTRLARSKDISYEKIAEGKIYRENGDKGKIGIPQEMLFSCLVGAGRNVKNGKKQISTAKTTTLCDLLTLNEFFFPFSNIRGNGSNSWEVDKRRGRLPDGIAIGIIRPKFKKWEFTVTIEYNPSKVDSSVLKELFENAGSTQGLGAFRPNCKGPFGRFKVKSWKETKSR